MEQYGVDFGSMPRESSAPGARVKVCQQEGKRLRLVEFGREFVEPVWCTMGHVGYVLEGRLEIGFDGSVVVFGPGDGLFIPAGSQHRHRAKVLADVVRIVLVEDM